jgi:hypothetical protein
MVEHPFSRGAVQLRRSLVQLGKGEWSALRTPKKARMCSGEPDGGGVLLRGFPAKRIAPTFPVRLELGAGATFAMVIQRCEGCGGATDPTAIWLRRPTTASALA